MRLKKLVSAAAAAILALSMSLTAVAAPSPGVSGVVTVDSVNNGVDGNGNKITATLGEVPAEYQDAVAEVRKPETLKALLGSAYKDTMSVVDVRDVIVPDGTVFPATITFKVPGVTASTNVAVLHYDTDKKAWEVVDSKAGQGTITATFNSLSPVAFVVDKSTSASVTSPQTGEHSMVVLLGAVAVVAACGAVGLSRKKRA
ncbi:MAG: LPXTG cell wall anchor domain-containing protein [Lachnospiraceae bacterium]|nr:LPXTG cell wall anchor domain-containing protein [Lachnospiraceae bacterium]